VDRTCRETWTTKKQNEHRSNNTSPRVYWSCDFFFFFLNFLHLACAKEMGILGVGRGGEGGKGHASRSAPCPPPSPPPRPPACVVFLVCAPSARAFPRVPSHSASNFLRDGPPKNEEGNAPPSASRSPLYPLSRPDPGRPSVLVSSSRRRRSAAATRASLVILLLPAPRPPPRLSIPPLP
jgi:hypothetical protein